MFETGRWKLAHDVAINESSVVILLKRSLIHGDNPEMAKKAFSSPRYQKFLAKSLGLILVYAHYVLLPAGTLKDNVYHPRVFYRFRTQKCVAKSRTQKRGKKHVRNRGTLNEFMLRQIS